MEFTFEGIKTELKNRLSLLSNWQNTLFFGVYERLIDIVAYIMGKLSYKADFLYKEAHWRHATKKESLAYMAEFLSYTPHRKIGAYGEIKMSADENFTPTYIYTGETVPIPKWTRFSNRANNVDIYCAEDSYYYKNTEGVALIPVREGVPKEFLYIASGIADEQITIYSESIDNEELDVYIVDANNNILEQVEIIGKDGNPDRLFFVDDLDIYYCEVKTNYDFQSVILTFGDGLDARKLTAGERVLIKYAETKGDLGNIQNAGVISRIKSEVRDTFGNIVALYVRNDDEISDGKDIEDIESIRHNGSYLFGAGYRCGGYRDWVTIINSIPYVQKSTIWTAEDLGGSTLMIEQNTVFITAISSDGSELTTAQKADIEANTLRDKKSPTEIISWQPLEKVYLKFDITGEIENKTISVMTQNIKDTLDGSYGVLNTDFQNNVYESNFINLIDDVEDLIWHQTQIFYMEQDLPPNISNYVVQVSFTDSETSILKNQVWLAEDTVEIWLKRKIAWEWQDPIQIGETNSSIITGMNGYVITGGAVSHTTNSISYVVQDIVNDVTQTIFGVRDPGEDDELGYVLNIVYKCRDGNNEQTNSVRIPYFYQITDIDPDYINVNVSYQ